MLTLLGKLGCLKHLEVKHSSLPHQRSTPSELSRFGISPTHGKVWVWQFVRYWQDGTRDPFALPKRFAWGTQFMINQIPLILFSQHLPHDFPPPNVRLFSFSGRRCSTGSHPLAFGVGHSCVSKLSWEKPRPGSRGGRHIIGKFLEERERDERKQEQPGTRGNACWGGCTALHSWRRAPSRSLWPASRSPDGANRTGLGKEDSSEATWCRMHM